MARDLLQVRLLGRFAVLRAGVEVPAAAFGGRKARRLLRVLAIEQDGFVSHDRLVDVLWADRPPADPAGNLSVLVTRVRSALGDPAWIVSTAGGYTLAADCLVDVHQFTAALDRARALLPGDPPNALTALRAAFAHWSGDPLPEDADEDWAGAHRSALLRRRQEALEDAAAVALDLREPTLALQWAEEAMAADPFREAGHVTAARAYAASGAAAAALEVLARFTRRLADELGIDPSPAVEAARLEVLTAGVVPARSPALPSLAPGPALPSLAPGPLAPRGAEPPLPFVGRRDVLARLGSATALHPDGRAGVAVLRGEAGAGKSRVLAEWTRRAGPTVTVRAFLPGRADALSLARRLFQALLESEPGLRAALDGPPADAVATLLLEAGADAKAGFDRETLVALLTEAAARLLRRSRCRAVVVDDLQWADPSSLHLIASVLVQVDGVPCVVAVRPSEAPPGSAAAAFLAEVAASRPADQLDLPALTADDLTTALAPDLAAALTEASGGNVFAVVDLLRGLSDAGLVRRGPDGWAATAGLASVCGALEVLAAEGRRRAFRARVRRLPAAERDLLVVLSVLARPAPVTTLATCLATSAAQVLALLTVLDAADLVRRSRSGWVTAHDLVRETVSADLPEAERARAHERLAAALAGADADPAEVAHHLAAAGDGDAAAARFVEVAERLAEGAADTEAAHLVETGLDCVQHADTRRRLLAVRSNLHSRRGDKTAAHADLAAALDGCPPGARRAALLTEAAMLHLGADDVRKAAALMELALVESAGDDRVRAHALEVASVVAMNLDDAEQAAAHADQAQALYVAAGDGAGAARVLDARAMATFLDGRITAATSAFGRARDLFTVSGALLRAVTPGSTLGHALVFAARPAEGLAETQAALDLARTLGHREGQTYALWHCAEAFAALGRQDEAGAAAGTALEVATELGHRGWTATAWRAVGIAHQGAGRLDEAEHAFRQSLATAHGFSLFTSWAAARLALVLVAQGRFAEAAGHVATATAEGPGLARYEADLAAAELAAGTDDPRRYETARQAVDRARTGGQAATLPRLAALATS